MLDESRGQLLYHKSEEEARCKPPMGHVELRGAAISLDLDNQNQFVIMSVPVPLSLSDRNKHLSVAVVHSGGGVGWGPACVRLCVRVCVCVDWVKHLWRNDFATENTRDRAHM